MMKGIRSVWVMGLCVGLLATLGTHRGWATGQLPDDSRAATTAVQESAPSNFPETRRFLTRIVPQVMTETGIVGLSLALFDDRRLVWARGFGWADQSQARPATADTRYRAGSIAKLFTAAAVLRLADQGRMTLDQPLKTSLPDFSLRSRFGDAGLISPRQILTHHAGLPEDYRRG